MPVHRAVGYVITITRSREFPDWVQASLRKQMWSVQTGTRSRQVAVAGFYANEMAEHQIIEGMLRELLRAYVDELG